MHVKVHIGRPAGNLPAAALKRAAPLNGQKKRVVILGGGPCGVTVLHQLQHMNTGFHVTVIDTKDFYEVRRQRTQP